MEKHAWVRISKNSYYLIRALEKLLTSFKNMSGEEEVNHLENDKIIKNYNVLDMWKKHWENHTAEENSRKKSHKNCFVKLSEWFDRLNDILMYCIKNSVALSPALERCTKLAGDIVQVNHTKRKEHFKSSQYFLFQ